MKYSVLNKSKTNNKTYGWPIQRNIRVAVLSLILIFYFLGNAFSQEIPRWSTFYENGFIWNPALTAQWYNWEASITHRQEWSGFEGAPQYSNMAFQVPLTDAFFRTQTSLGTFIERDQIGPYSIIGVAGTYSYKFSPQLFGRKGDMLALGMMGAFRNFSVNPEKIVVYDNRQSVDPISTALQPNFSLGFFYRSIGPLYKSENHFFLGGSLQRVLPYTFGRSSFSNVTNSFSFTAHGGFRAFGYGDFFVEPNIMMVYSQLAPIDVMISLRGEMFETYWFGTGVSTTGELFGQVGVVFDGRSVLGSLVGDGILRVGVKSDYHLGSLSRFSGLGYEIYMAYQFEIE